MCLFRKWTWRWYILTRLIFVVEVCLYADTRYVSKRFNKILSLHTWFYAWFIYVFIYCFPHVFAIKWPSLGKPMSYTRNITVLYIHNTYTQGPTNFSKTLGATSKFKALKGWHVASSILRNYNFGVMCKPHFYLAPSARLCGVVHLCVCKETIAGMLKIFTRGTRDPRVWCTLAFKYYFPCMWILYMLRWYRNPESVCKAKVLKTNWIFKF